MDIMMGYEMMMSGQKDYYHGFYYGDMGGGRPYNGYELIGYSGGAPSAWLLPLYAMGMRPYSACVGKYSRFQDCFSDIAFGKLFTMPHNTWTYGPPRHGNWIMHKHTMYTPWMVYGFASMSGMYFSMSCDMRGGQWASLG